MRRGVPRPREPGREREAGRPGAPPSVVSWALSGWTRLEAVSRLRRQSGEDPELGALSFAKRQHCCSYDARAIQTGKLVHLMRVTMIDEHVGQNHGSDLEPAIEQLRLGER